MSSIRISKEHPTPYVYIDRDAFDDMLCIARATDAEVAWFAQVRDEGDGVFVIDNVYLPKQQSSASTVEIEPEHLMEFAEEYIEQQGPEAYNRLRCWGHSHAKMGVTPSYQDQKTVDELCAAIKSVFIAIRVNHAGAFAVDVAYPSGITFEDTNAFIGWIPREKEESWAAIVKDRVQKITYQYTKKVAAAGKPAGALPSGAYTAGSAYSYWDDPDDDDDITNPKTMSNDEEQAMITEAITHIHRFPYEKPLAYLKRVERLEALEMEDL